MVPYLYVVVYSPPHYLDDDKLVSPTALVARVVPLEILDLGIVEDDDADGNKIDEDEIDNGDDEDDDLKLSKVEENDQSFRDHEETLFQFP